MKFRIVENLESPCADISFKYSPRINASLKIKLFFSLVKDGFDKDIEATFLEPVSVKWEREDLGLIELPDNLPKCKNEKYKNFTYPSLVLSNSKWADLYAARMFTEAEFKDHQLKHYIFIALNDLLHVLAFENPETKILNA